MNQSLETHHETVISVNNLVRDYGEKLALKGISLQIPRGKVYGLVGENGAGKTTLIKHILGLLKAQKGSVKVFGEDPVSNPPGVLSRIGYLSEEPDLPPWMSINELMRYSSAFYSKWDNNYALELVKIFELNPKAKIKSLSKGQRARVGLIIAQAHRPDLLLLDEPSSGLDPIVRRDILGAIIRTVADEGRTVLFSSHHLDEVEQVSDVLTMISKGNLVLEGLTEDVLQEHYRVAVRGDSQAEPHFEGLLSATRMGREWCLDCRGEWQSLKAILEKNNLHILSNRGMSLNDIFVAHSGVRPDQEAS